MAGKAKTDPLFAEKVRKAIELRKAGATYDKIAEALGYENRSGAYKIVVGALRDLVQEPAQELRTLELERLDAMTLAIWARAQKGELAAVDRLLKIGERRAKLLGLDAPTAQSVDMSVGTFDGPTPARAAELVRRAFGRVTPKDIGAPASADAERSTPEE